MAEAKLDITDELLVAYVDDELDPTRRELVNSVLATSPALVRRADEMRLARDILREAFPLHPEATVPAPIEAAANRFAEAHAQRSSPTPLGSSFRSRRKYAIAAGLVLCAAASGGYLIWRVGAGSARDSVTALMQIGRDTPLHELLESTPSAKEIKVPAENIALRAILTFRAKDGRFCREFEIDAGSGGSTGIACRQNGEWHAEVLLSTRAAPTHSSYYTPAGESDDPAIAGVVDRLIQGEPLGAAEEALVLATGWGRVQTP